MAALFVAAFRPADFLVLARAARIIDAFRGGAAVGILTIPAANLSHKTGGDGPAKPLVAFRRSAVVEGRAMGAFCASAGAVLAETALACDAATAAVEPIGGRVDASDKPVKDAA